MKKDPSKLTEEEVERFTEHSNKLKSILAVGKGAVVQGATIFGLYAGLKYFTNNLDKIVDNVKRASATIKKVKKDILDNNPKLNKLAQSLSKQSAACATVLSAIMTGTIVLCKAIRYGAFAYDGTKYMASKGKNSKYAKSIALGSAAVTAGAIGYFAYQNEKHERDSNRR